MTGKQLKELASKFGDNEVMAVDIVSGDDILGLDGDLQPEEVEAVIEELETLACEDCNESIREAINNNKGW